VASAPGRASPPNSAGRPSNSLVQRSAHCCLSERALRRQQGPLLALVGGRNTIACGAPTTAGSHCLRRWCRRAALKRPSSPLAASSAYSLGDERVSRRLVDPRPLGTRCERHHRSFARDRNAARSGCGGSWRPECARLCPLLCPPAPSNGTVEPKHTGIIIRVSGFESLLRHHGSCRGSKFRCHAIEDGLGLRRVRHCRLLCRPVRHSRYGLPSRG
jgi:hypothetical protein